MTRFSLCTALIATGLLATACSSGDSASTPPRITAQGFALGTPVAGVVGAFPETRLRIEASGRIAELTVTEGGAEVELARTEDRAQFRLFGLSTRPLKQRDVTLDVSPYLNEHFAVEGRHEITVVVTDEGGQRASVVIQVEVRAPEDALEAEGAARSLSAPVEVGEFLLRRVGSGPVERGGSEPVAIEWRTVESVHVTISIRAGSDSVILVPLDSALYDEIVERDQLVAALAVPLGQTRIDMTTANNLAASQVFAVVGAGRAALLRVTSSETHLSEVGTTVILRGTYKY